MSDVATARGRLWHVWSRERNAATYEIAGEVASVVLKAPLCFLVIAGGYVPISRDLAQDVWREGSAPAR